MGGSGQLTDELGTAVRCAAAVKSSVHRIVAVSAPRLSAGNVRRMHRGIGAWDPSTFGQRYHHVAGRSCWTAANTIMHDQSILCWSFGSLDIALHFDVVKYASTWSPQWECRSKYCPSSGDENSRMSRPDASIMLGPIIVYLDSFVAFIE